MAASATSRGRPKKKRRPSRGSALGRSLPSGAGGASGSVERSISRRNGMTAATKTNDRPLATNAAAVPNSTTAPPASAVPARRPTLWTAEPRAIAEGTSRVRTRSLPRSAQAGLSTVAMMPVTADRISSSGTFSAPRATRAAVAKATTPRAVWLSAAVSLRGQASTAAPPTRPSSRPGPAWTARDTPVMAAEPVTWRTSRFWTVSCIQVPALDTRFATDHQRMLG